MLHVYIGDSINISSRIKRRHCSGNVKTSVFRYHVAEKMGFKIVKQPKISRFGNEYTEIYIAVPYRREGEKQVSAYVATGKWKFVECASKQEANDFQYYVIEKMTPQLNVLRANYKSNDITRYEDLFEKLNECPWTDKSDALFPLAPGVYVFGNDSMPVKL